MLPPALKALRDHIGAESRLDSRGAQLLGELNALDNQTVPNEKLEKAIVTETAQVRKRFEVSSFGPSGRCPVCGK